MHSLFFLICKQFYAIRLRSTKSANCTNAPVTLGKLAEKRNGQRHVDVTQLTHVVIKQIKFHMRR